MWEPWVGAGYEDRRVLLLGESCCDWRDRSGVMQYPQVDHPSMIVYEARDMPFEGAATIRKLTRALSHCETPTPAQASAGWDRVAFTNYIPVSVGHGARIPKARAMWLQGEAELPAVLNMLNPQVVIVLGLSMWNRMPATQVVVSDKVQGYRLSNGRIAMCHAEPHPSMGSSWKHYAAVIDRAFKQAI